MASSDHPALTPPPPPPPLQAPPPPPPPHHQRSTQQQPVTTQVNISFEEVANLFPFPIAEAAATLGVSTNELKRICRENGLNRWPYRKIVAGKTVEDVKKEAAREIALSERMARTQQSKTTSNGLRADRPGSYSLGTIGTTERDPQQPMSRPNGFYAHASSLKQPHLDQRPQLNSHFHMRVNIPTYLDDFRHGFPSKGLSSLSSKWWGSSLPDEIVADKVHEDTKMDISSDDITKEPEADQENRSCGTETSKEIKRDENDKQDLTLVGKLIRSRKNSAASGQKALGLAVTRGYRAHRVTDKDEALLRAIFTEAFPTMWRASMPN